MKTETEEKAISQFVKFQNTEALTTKLPAFQETLDHGGEFMVMVCNTFPSFY